MPKSLVLLLLVTLTVVVLAMVPSDSVAHSGHPQKALFPDRWCQRLSDSGSYATWMTLTGHRHYGACCSSAVWAGPITSALNGYNGTGAGAQHTVYITDYTPSPLHDVHTAVTNGCWVDDFGAGARCVPTHALGITYLFDQLIHLCTVGGTAGNCDADHSRPNTWWYAQVLLDNDEHTGFYGTAFQRQATAAHELGHAIVLAHNGIGDGLCGTAAIPRTVMDYDCLDLGILNTPQAWDSCGINHAYFDPNWGYAGC